MTLIKFHSEIERMRKMLPEFAELKKLLAGGASMRDDDVKKLAVDLLLGTQEVQSLRAGLRYVAEPMHHTLADNFPRLEKQMEGWKKEIVELDERIENTVLTAAEADDLEQRRGLLGRQVREHRAEHADSRHAVERLAALKSDGLI